MSTMQYVFIGNEAETWSTDDHKAAAATIKAKGYNTAVVKVADGPNTWYSDHSDLLALQSLYKAADVDLLPFTFCYGNAPKYGSSVTREHDIALDIAGVIGKVVLDVEDGYENAPIDLDILCRGFPTGTKLYISTFANPAEHSMIDGLKRVLPYIVAIMPQVYTSYLLGVWQTQYSQIGPIPLLPTYSQATLFKTVSVNFGYWEYQDLEQVAVTSMAKVNSRGMVMEYVQTDQFLPNDTQGACGYFAVALNKYASPPDIAPNTSADAVNAFALAEYKKVYGSIGIDQVNGMNVPELHTACADAGNLHYYDISTINATSTQQTDISTIKRALQAGYPVIGFISESSVRDLTGDIPAGSPYSWNTDGIFHIVTYVGISPDGHLLVVDPANINGSLTGDNSARPWPRKYDVATLANQFCSVIQIVPFHNPIPGPDPLKWSANFTGQVVNMSSDPRQGFFETQCENIWNSVNKTPRGTGIYHAWKTDFWLNTFHGVPVTGEIHTIDRDNTPIIMQVFSKDTAVWNIAKSTVQWI